MELETVIARTLALRRKSSIEAVDLVFDFGDEAAHMADLADLTEFTPAMRSPISSRRNRAFSRTA